VGAGNLMISPFSFFNQLVWARNLLKSERSSHSSRYYRRAFEVTDYSLACKSRYVSNDHIAEGNWSHTLGCYKWLVIYTRVPQSFSLTPTTAVKFISRGVKIKSLWLPCRRPVSGQWIPFR
jgi:hypothetical protein